MLECNQRHGGPPVHMTLDDVATLRADVPAVPFFLTHVGPDVDSGGLPRVVLPADLETVYV